jgi:FMN reductase
MTAARRIAVVSAGLSNPSSTRMLADRLAAATLAALRAQGIEAEVDVFELRDHAHDITNNLLTGFAPPALESMINAVVSADALIAVTPIFSTSYSGLFKSFIDVLDPDALTGKPVLIGANAGTARHSLAIDYAIRPLFAYLHAEPVSTGVFAASADWGGAGDQVAPLASASTGPPASSPTRSRDARPRHPSIRSTRRTTSARDARSGTSSAASRGSSAQPSTMSDGASSRFQAPGRAAPSTTSTSAPTSAPRSTPASSSTSAIGTWNVRKPPRGAGPRTRAGSMSSAWSSTKPAEESSPGAGAQAATFQNRRGIRMPRYGGSSPASTGAVNTLIRWSVESA